jgi:hypothetical protein
MLGLESQLILNGSHISHFYREARKSEMILQTNYNKQENNFFFEDV